MMKKNWMKLTTAAFGTAALLCLPLTASAETSGYWTMETDEEGRQVMVYTYTSLDDITYEPVEGMSPADEADDPGEDAPAVPEARQVAAQNPQSPKDTTGRTGAGSTGGLTAVGVLSLAGLAAVLYKVI